MNMWKKYQKEYYYSHKDKFKIYQKRYLQKVKKELIYRILNKSNDKIMYIGSTESPFRLNYHANGFSNLNLKENEYGKIQYSEVISNNVAITREELYFIEFYLINKHRPTKNSKCKDLDKFDFTEEKKEQLIKLADDLNFQNW